MSLRVAMRTCCKKFSTLVRLSSRSSADIAADRLPSAAILACACGFSICCIGVVGGFSPIACAAVLSFTLLLVSFMIDVPLPLIRRFMMTPPWRRHMSSIKTRSTPSHRHIERQTCLTFNAALPRALMQRRMPSRAGFESHQQKQQ
jgi:hypothetical protein